MIFVPTLTTLKLFTGFNDPCYDLGARYCEAVQIYFDPNPTRKYLRLNWNYFFPRTPSSFSNQVLSDGFIRWKTHTWNDLINVQFNGTMVDHHFDDYKRYKVGYGYTNLLNPEGYYAPFIIPNRNGSYEWINYGNVAFKDARVHRCLTWCRLGQYTVLTFTTFTERDRQVLSPQGKFVDSFTTELTLYLYKHVSDTSFAQLANQPMFQTVSSALSSKLIAEKVLALAQRLLPSWDRLPVRPWDLSSYSSLVRVATPLRRSDLSIHRPSFEQCSDLFPVPERNRMNWPEMAAKAYQDLGMADINGIANVKELAEMGETVIGFAKTLKSIPSKKVKAVAQTWLAVHYGFKLTILDARELSETLEDFCYRRSSLSKCQARSDWRCGARRYEATYQVFFDTFAQLRSTLLQCIAISDGFLTLENAWDMVPWSFVIDWFLDLGSILQSLDNWFNLTQRHDVVAVGKSIKGSSMIEARRLVPEFVGGISATYYAREYDKELVFPSILPHVTLLPFNHLVEAAALFISLR